MQGVTGVRWLLPLFAVIVGCGSSGGGGGIADAGMGGASGAGGGSSTHVGSCDIMEGFGICTDYSGAGYDSATLMQSCASNGDGAGQWKNGPCPSNWIAGCSKAEAEGTETDWYYPPKYEVEVQELAARHTYCNDVGGTWVTP